MSTTLSLWASRRLPRVRRPRVLLVIVCVLVVAAATVGIFRLASTSSARPSARASSSARPHQARPGGSAGQARAAGPAGAAASVRSQVAAWIAGQLSSADTIGCDPLMCTALSAHGVAASRLLPLGAMAATAPGADVIAASPAARTGLSQAAPVLLASVGAGSSLIEVRATSPGGTASYQAALAADIGARKMAGGQLLRSGRIQAGAPGAGQLQAGQVDSRLLTVLAMLASQRSWRVIAFGDTSPGVPLSEAPFRQVIITGAGGANGAAGLTAALALLRAQRPPYQPAQVTTVQLAGGQTGLRIDFATPSPLGLLTGSTSR